MNKMIERVAENIYYKLYVINQTRDTDVKAVVVPPEYRWETRPEDAKNEFRKIAVAAVKAMREPTEETLHSTDFIYKSPEYEVIVNCWQAMIDAALKDD